MTVLDVHKPTDDQDGQNDPKPYTLNPKPETETAESSYEAFVDLGIDFKNSGVDSKPRPPPYSNLLCDFDVRFCPPAPG